MPPTDALANFLLGHPWSHYKLLQKVYGKQRYRLVLEEAKQNNTIRSISLPALGDFFAHKQEQDKTIPALFRWYVLRKFVLGVMGAQGFFGGLSPGLTADGQYYWERSCKEWLLWVDMGGCAPEALGFVRNPPGRSLAEMGKIIVTTEPERVDLVAAQIKRSWRGQGDVFVYHENTNVYRELHLGHLDGAPRKNITTQKMLPEMEHFSFHQDRIAPDRVKNLLGASVVDFALSDYGLIIFIGNNPLMTLHEIACSFQQGRNYKKLISRMRKFMKRSIIHDVNNGRVVLAGKGLKILSSFWGTTIENMAQFHPWPQKINSRGRQVYTIKWAKRIKEHTRLVREFALGLEEGSRRVTKAYGGADVEIVTMVGSRYVYEENDKGNVLYGWVMPDALFDVKIWTRPWADGAANGERRTMTVKKIMLEVDRATNSINKIEVRMDKFEKIWPSLNNKAALVWLISGSPSREKRILEMMNARGIDGWTVLYDRLILRRNNPWWSANPVTGVSVGYDAMGEMAPWRPIWNSVHGEMQQNFLGHAPWVRNLQMSQDVENYQLSQGTR